MYVSSKERGPLVELAGDGHIPASRRPRDAIGAGLSQTTIAHGRTPMTPAARSMYWFGIYATLTGAGFLIAPQMMIANLHVSPLESGWARVIGIFALIIGLDDIVAARAECLPFLKLSVPLRYAFVLTITTLVATGQLATPTLMFGAIDFVGATWTLLALRGQSAVRSVA
jgi:hypothetical protein